MGHSTLINEKKKKKRRSCTTFLYVKIGQKLVVVLKFWRQFLKFFISMIFFFLLILRSIDFTINPQQHSILHTDTLSIMQLSAHTQSARTAATTRAARSLSSCLLFTSVLVASLFTPALPLPLAQESSTESTTWFPCHLNYVVEVRLAGADTMSRWHGRRGVHTPLSTPSRRACKPFSLHPSFPPQPHFLVAVDNLF